MMRTPNVNIGARTPTINPTVTPRIDANIAGRTNVVTGVDRLPSSVTTTTSTMRVTSHQSQFDDALCALFAEPLSGLRKPPIATATANAAASRLPPAMAAAAANRPRRARAAGYNSSQAGINLRRFPNQTRGRDRRRVDRRAGRCAGAASRAGADGIAEFSADRRHHRAVPHHRQSSGRCRAPRTRRRGRRPRVQLNFRYWLQDQKAAERRRSRAICLDASFACRRRTSWRMA